MCSSENAFILSKSNSILVNFAGRFGAQSWNEFFGMTVTRAVPYLGCGPLDNSATGGIIVVKRGECSFSQKVFMAQQAGAAFVLIVNSGTGTLMPMGCHYTDPKCAEITIPSLMVDRDVWNDDLRPVHEGSGVTLDITCPLDDDDPNAPSEERVVYDNSAWDSLPHGETPFEQPDDVDIMEQGDGYTDDDGDDDESTGLWSKCAQRNLPIVGASCGASVVGGECHSSKTMTFFDAQDVCAVDGGRLCTQTEINNRVAHGSGCDLDSELVWTSTPCAIGHRAVVGGGRTAKEHEAASECASDASATFPTRCCYDDQPSSASTKTCSSLGWDEHPLLPDLCSSSLDDNACARSGEFSTAVAVCERSGARLCTFDELQAGSMRGGGCKAQQVWSSTPCGISQTVRSFFTSNSGGGKAHTCAPVENYSAPIGCCADRVPAGALSGPLDSAGYAADPYDPSEGLGAVLSPGKSLRTCTELGWRGARNGRPSKRCASSQVNGSTPELATCYKKSVSFGAAVEVCASMGARLCTLDEAFNGATDVQGCGMNRQYFWVNAPCASGHRVARGLDGAGNACWHPAALKKVRCCADQS